MKKMKRYKKIVLKVDEGIFFDVLEKKEEGLVIKIGNKTNNETSTLELTSPSNPDHKELAGKHVHYLHKLGRKSNYMKPPIPDHYEYVEGKWNRGFVIRNKRDGSEFVWVPVGSLEANGTLDGEHFDQQFGRRNYCGDDFSEKGYYEPMTEEFKRQCESVKKYGGFYISRYDISRSIQRGKPQSIKGEYPWTSVTQNEAIKIAGAMENDSELISSHLLWASEYDSVLEWFIESGKKTEREVCFKHNKCTNQLYRTGQKKAWEVNAICDFSENVWKWTQERYHRARGEVVVRGSDYDIHAQAGRRWAVNSCDAWCGSGFRSALYIK